MNMQRLRCVAAMVLATSAIATATAADTKSKDDAKEFITDAIQGNLSEQKVGELAEQRGASEGVRSFGAMLKKDHATANRSAEQAAQALGVTPPSQPNAKEKAIYAKLSKLQGDKFDKEFIKDMLDDHKKDVSKYEKQASSSNATVAQYAKQTLPDLRKHLETVQNLQSKEKSSS